MFSIKTPICSSPRPATSKASPPGVSLTLIATLVSASFISRSRITRLCTLSPSRPARGESLIPKVTEIVGGSIGCAGIASDTARSASVSATVALAMPARLTMSPAAASSTGARDSPRNASTLETRNRSISRPSRSTALIVCPVRTEPLSIRPVSSRPMNGSAASVVASIANGSPVRATCAGAGT